MAFDACYGTSDGSGTYYNSSWGNSPTAKEFVTRVTCLKLRKQMLSGSGSRPEGVQEEAMAVMQAPPLFKECLMRCMA
jgi:hypothetical protein